MRHSEAQGPKTFGEKVRERRKRAKMSVARFSEATGIDRADVWRLESGLRENPTLATVMNIAKALRCKPAALIPGLPDDNG